MTIFQPISKLSSNVINKYTTTTAASTLKYSTNNVKPRRVVITGLGIVSPIGCTIKKAWQSLLNGECGIRKLTDPRYDKLPCQIAGQICRDELNIENIFSKSDLKKMAPATSLALIAAEQAMEMTEWNKLTTEQNDHNTNTATTESIKQRTGVTLGMGMIDLMDVCETNKAFETNYNRISPFFVPRILPNMAAGMISMKYGLHGPNHSVSTACATGVHAIGDAFRFIKYNDADMMICGGAESCISPLSIAGFCRLRALCTNKNEQPEQASRPFDRDRSGFIMGEGSGVLILEELQHALERKIPIIAELLGYGLSGDAAHLTAPHENGLGAQLAMKRAIREAGLNVNDISYINAHATSTPLGDAIEVKAIRSVFGKDHCENNLQISSTKGAHGHLLGSAGNLETIFTSLACQTGEIPPTINLENLSNEMYDLNFVPNKSQQWNKPNNNKKRIALKNSFGFGGTNASICIAEFIN